MERITFKYSNCYDFKDSDEQTDIVFTMSDKDEIGLKDYEVCEKFMDFIHAVGFSETNVLNYFRN